MAGRPLTFTLCGTRWVCGGARPSICWSSLTPRICQTHWISFRPERRHVFWWMFLFFCPWGKLSEGPPKLLCFLDVFITIFYFLSFKTWRGLIVFCFFFFPIFCGGFSELLPLSNGVLSSWKWKFLCFFFQWRHHCCLQFFSGCCLVLARG